MIVRSLTAADTDALHAAFVEAFSDYVVPMAPPLDRLTEMLARRGYDPSVSPCATVEGRIVAFTLNATEGAQAYDTGTGVVPMHRRRGLARLMMERSFTLLHERGCKDYRLEVIDTNDAAIALYRDLGFREMRGLQCWSYEGEGEPATILRSAPHGWEAWWETQPSWQNSTASLGRAGDERVVMGGDDGVAVVFPLTGEVAQLAVRPSARRRGIGSSLLRQARAVAVGYPDKPLRILNVDERDVATAAFLEAAGARRTIRQLEMLRPL